MIVIRLLITIPLPIQVYLLVQKNKPVGSLEDPTHRYDDDGDLVRRHLVYSRTFPNSSLLLSIYCTPMPVIEQVEYSDAMYRIDLIEDEQKANPFNWCEIFAP